MSERNSGGLCTIEGAPIPLRAVDVLGDVVGGSARVKVRQRYENVEKKPLEAIYTFPLPSEATLVGFVMECDGRRVEGVVKEREDAFRTYDDAMLAGHGAALLDQERPNVFTASVGNLLPGETTVVEVEYVQRLHADEGALRVAIPTLVAPRYVPGAPKGDRTGHGVEGPTDRVPDADRISPRIGAADYTVSLDLVLRVGARVDVSSPSHRIETSAVDGGVRVSFADGRVPLDRDVVLLVEGASGAELTSVVAHKEGEIGTFVLSHVPDLLRDALAPRKAPLDVVFLLDRSGSMGGASIEEARKALRLCLRQLREGDRFSVVAFDDREELFRPAPVPFTQKTLEQADAWVRAIDARGGTELLAPLVRAVELAKDGVVVLLTDGQVGNEDEILAAVLDKRGKTRVYAFGIGTNVSDALLRQLGKRTGGGVEFIHPGERIDEKVVATFARAIAPRVRDVRVKWVGLEVDDLARADVPDLVDGEPFVLFGRYKGEARGRAEIRGTLGDAPWLLEVPIELPARADAPALPKLWAAERVRDLEAMEVTGRRAKAMQDRIVALATEHGIASRYTSFVVVETRTGDRRVREAAEARPIPVHAPAGWAMFQPRMQRMAFTGAPPPMAMPQAMPAPGPIAPSGAFVGRAAPPAAPAAPPAPMPARANSASFFTKAKRAVASVFERDDMDEGVAYELAAPGGAAADGGDPAFAIFARQLASGLWDDGGAGDDDVRRVQSTARALVDLLRLGVDAAHPQHGELVRKAIEALVPLAAAVAPRAKDAAELAFSAAWLAATGKRTRRVVREAIGRAGLSALDGRLGDEAALRNAVLAT